MLNTPLLPRQKEGSWVKMGGLQLFRSTHRALPLDDEGSDLSRL